ncbi:ABC-three component system middle component 7 [Candidatus Nitrospira salsa]
MIMPDKFSSLDESTLGKVSHLLLDDVIEITVSDLMKMKVGKFVDVGEFILALDVLFVLGKIELDIDKKVVRYVA